MRVIPAILLQVGDTIISEDPERKGQLELVTEVSPAKINSNGTHVVCYKTKDIDGDIVSNCACRSDVSFVVL